MNQELLNIPRDLLLDLLENTITLQGENHWKQSETRRGYDIEYQQWTKQIQEVKKILEIKNGDPMIFFGFDKDFGE